jgi:hypothetical protein
MAVPDRTGVSEKTNQTGQYVLNYSFDEAYKILMVGLAAYNPDTQSYDRVQIGSDGKLTTDDTASVPTTPTSGRTLVTTAGTRVQLATGTITSVTIKALSSNTGTIYIGTSTVTATNGFQLGAGESVSMDIGTLGVLYIDSSVNGEGVTYLGVV